MKKKGRGLDPGLPLPRLPLTRHPVSLHRLSVGIPVFPKKYLD